MIKLNIGGKNLVFILRKKPIKRIGISTGTHSAFYRRGVRR